MFESTNLIQVAELLLSTTTTPVKTVMALVYLAGISEETFDQLFLWDRTRDTVVLDRLDDLLEQHGLGEFCSRVKVPSKGRIGFT